MSNTKEALHDFVRKSLARNHSKADIEKQLLAERWSREEVDLALASWSDTQSEIPIPRPRSRLKAADLFLFGLLFIAIFVIAINLLVLSFYVIDKFFDEISTHRDRSARWAIASLIVFTPVFLYLSPFFGKKRKVDTSAARSSIRKWLAYISLLVAVLVLLGDLIFVIFSLLNGSLFVETFLRLVAVGLISLGIILYYRTEIQELGDA